MFLLRVFTKVYFMKKTVIGVFFEGEISMVVGKDGCFKMVTSRWLFLNHFR